MTFTTTPATYSTVNSELTWVVYDANSIDVTKLNYKYVAEVFINAVKVFTAKTFPKPGGSIGVFDFSAIIREYLVANYAPTSAGMLAQEMLPIKVVIKIKEEYNGTIGAVVSTDSERTIFNYYDVDFSAYINKVNSLRPKEIEGYFTQSKLYIPYLATSTSTYNVVVGANTKVITPSAANTMQVLNISPTAINIDYTGTITASTESYVVAINGVSYTVKLKCEPMFTQYSVHFLNRFGGFETMYFGKASKLTKDVNKKSYQQAASRITDAGVLSYKTGDTFHQQKTTFGATLTKRLKLSTDWVTDQEHVWLSDLFTSPIVLLDYEGSTHYVTITETNYEEKRALRDGLSQVVINVEFGSTLNTQFR